MKHLPGGMMIGRPPFVETTIRAEHLADKLSERDLPDLKELQAKSQASHVEAMIDRIVEDDAKLARNLEIYFIRHRSGTPIEAIDQPLDEVVADLLVPNWKGSRNDSI